MQYCYARKANAREGIINIRKEQIQFIKLIIDIVFLNLNVYYIIKIIKQYTNMKFSMFYYLFLIYTKYIAAA